jgi:hypothetical protein
VFWVALFVPLGVVSVAVLGFFTWQLWRRVQQFGRDVAAAGDRIGQASAEIQRVAPQPRR